MFVEIGWGLRESVYDLGLGLGRVVGGLRREHDMYFVIYKNENFDVGNGP